MNKCDDCQTDLVLFSNKVSEQLSQKTYWCSTCRAQKVKSVLSIPGDAFDLNPYSHYEQMREYGQTAIECSSKSNEILSVMDGSKQKSA